MSVPPIRVLIADDHTVVREGIRAVLEEEPDLEVVADAADGTAALDLASRLEPDVVILDLTMPGMSGLEVTEALKRAQPDTPVLILSMHDHPEYVLGAVRAGAKGYLLKDCGPRELREAVRAIRRGEEFFSARTASQLSAAVRGKERLAQLTDREREVLSRVARGLTSREIADEFGISHRTVETHRESLMRKLSIHSVAGLTRFALENGLVTEEA